MQMAEVLQLQDASSLQSWETAPSTGVLDWMLPSASQHSIFVPSHAWLLLQQLVQHFPTYTTLVGAVVSVGPLSAQQNH